MLTKIKARGLVLKWKPVTFNLLAVRFTVANRVDVCISRSAGDRLRPQLLTC